MKYEIQINSSYQEPKVIILTAEMTDDVNAIVKKLMEGQPSVLSGFKDDKIKILEPTNLLRIYSSSGKVIAVTEQGEYTLRLRLYEVEERLNSNSFVRISNSEIINLNKIENFDLSIVGTISIKMSDGTISYVSRRFVKKIKKLLGL